MSIPEELGVALVGQQASDSFAGVPIKKRRFPIVRSPSPPPRKPSSVLETDGPQHEQTVSEPGSSYMSVTESSVTTEGYPLEDRGGCSTDENLKLSLSNESSIGLRLHHSTVAASSEEAMSYEVKNIPDGSLVFQRVPENSALLLASKEPFFEKKLMLSDTSAPKGVSGNTKLQLGLREPSGQPAGSQDNGRSSQKLEMLHQGPWVARESYRIANEGKLKGLALAKEEDNGPCIESKAGCAPFLAERSQWDLNTTMETWEESSGHSVINRRAAGTVGLNLGVLCEQKPVICPNDSVQEHSLSDHATLENENSTKLPSSTTHPDEDSNFKVQLLKQLTPPHGLLSCFDQGPVVKSDTPNSMRKTSDLSGQLKSPATGMKLVGSKPLKLEPLEGGSLAGHQTVDGCNLNLVNQRTPKPEPFDEAAQVGNRTVHPSSRKSIDSRAVKPEPLEESRQECPNKVAGTSDQLDLRSCSSEMPVNEDTALVMMGNAIEASETVPKSVGLDGKESIVPDKEADPDQMTLPGDVNHEPSNSILDEHHICSSTTDGATEGNKDDEIKKSADIRVDGPSNQDMEIDVSQNPVGTMSTVGKQQNDEYDYEDGEVREPLVHDAVEDVCDIGNAENIDNVNSDDKKADESGIHRDDFATSSSHLEDGEDKTEVPCETTIDHCSEEHDNTPSSEKKDQGDCSIPTTEAAAAGPGKKRAVKVTRRLPRDCPKGPETVSDQAVGENRVTVTDDVHRDNKNRRDKVKVPNSIQDSHANAHKMQTPVAAEDANKDVQGKGRSRIINLARTDDALSLGKMKYTTSKSMPSRTGKEKFPDRGEKYPRGSRADMFMDGLRKFERERNENPSVGKSELDYMPVRGRADKSLDALSGGWDSERDHASEHYLSTTDFRFSRHKKAAAFPAAKLECNSFVPPDGAMINAARAGGRPKNEDMQSFRHMPLRRRSPVGRDGPVPLGMQMVRVPLRDTSPERCISGGGPDMVVLRQAGGREGPMPGVQIQRRSLRDLSPERRIGGDGPNMVLLKNDEKFIRGFPDMMDPLFTRRQPQYQRVENPFVRRERSLSPIQRRHSLRVPRVSSKSPPRSRSPCQWSPPRRRSPAGFDGRVELMHGRPPAILRVERMRPPQGRPCFAEDVMDRRRDSPPYVSRLPNDVRDVGPSREHDHRLLIRRSPSGRVSRRSTRRLEMMDPRERTGGDEYFGPHSGRVRELVDDGCVDERRKCSEGRGLLRPFRPIDSGTDAETFVYHAEDGSRPSRIFPEEEAEFRERVTSRDFDRHIKYRLGNPRRPRSIEEQEDNYGHGGPGWHDTNYDIIRLKKRRL